MREKVITIQDAIDILTSQGKFYINLGLERVERILEIIENPQKKLKFIHVAGTNGKGSVCSMLSSIITNGNVVGCTSQHKNNNLKVGLFTSPHVFEYTERIKINNEDIEKEIFAKKIVELTEIAQANEIHLTEFEILTVVAFDYFAENNVDIVVLETGLGGRLDATNIIESNLCSIITHIDLDHTERLGDTIEKIAFEKAGIIKNNCPVVVGSNNSGLEIVKSVAKEKNSPVIFSEDTQNLKKHFDENLALKGLWQKENLALVLKAIELLNNKGLEISQDAITKGLKNVKHPCRFQYLKEQNILIDGAHNPNGIKSLRESLNEYFPNQKIKFIFGCLKNKEHLSMVNSLFNKNDEIYFFHFSHQNSCDYETLASECKFKSLPFSEFKYDVKTLTVVCGSFYMIKEVLTKMGIK